VNRYITILLLLVVAACVDPIQFTATDPGNITILEGTITTDPGPYVILISRGLRLDSDSTINAPVPGAVITLHSDKGETESFAEVEPGVYHTGGAILGTIGTTYHITLKMPDGATFESEPETILPSGEVTDIRYQYEARTVQKSYGPQAADVFNIYVDATAGPLDPGETSFVRWRFSGLYVTATNPEKHTTYLQGFLRFKTPWPCSGWVVDPGAGGGVLRQDSECTCCRCWIQQYESLPRLSDTDLVEGGEFRNIKVGEVPITRMTFYEKYRVSIDQMTISKNAFNFFKIIRTQKEGASNLFQPPPGKITGNIKPVNADYNIAGMFWGASVHRKSIYIHETDLPYLLPVDTIPLPCNYAYANASITKPGDWDDDK
jgi:hypothetical protein